MNSIPRLVLRINRLMDDFGDEFIETATVVLMVISVTAWVRTDENTWLIMAMFIAMATLAVFGREASQTARFHLARFGNKE